MKADSQVNAHVGRLVRERRKSMGMSQQKLGEAIGLTFQQVHKLEKGTVRIGSSRLMQIANALDVEPMHFFEGGPTATRPTVADHPMQFVDDFVVSKDGRALIKAFAKLPKEVRRSVVTLVESVARHE